MITVVHTKWHVKTRKDVYIGRPSPLGNPYSHLDKSIAQYKVASREEAIEKYRAWLTAKIEAQDPAVMAALARIKPDSVLVCWCKPAACHGDVIKELLEARWATQKET